MTVAVSPSAIHGVSEGLTLTEHLVELRSRVMKATLALAVGAAVAWMLYPLIVDVLLHPYQAIAADRTLTNGRLLQTDPLEGFAIRLKIALYGGAALAMPMILWQIWRFVCPGLHRHEKKYTLAFVAAGAALFATGAGIAYWTLPKALAWLVGVGGGDLVTAYSPTRYFQFILYMMLVFGLCFEFPILLVGLQLAGVVQTRTLRTYRRHAIVGIAVVVAVATPSNDPISMLALSVPLVVFYEAAVQIGRVVERHKQRRSARP